MGTLLPRQAARQRDEAHGQAQPRAGMRQRSRASTISRYTVPCTIYQSISEVISVRLYVLSEHLGGRRVRGLIGPARIEPPVAALQTTLVPRRHQLYPIRAPQSTSEVCPRPRTVTRGVTAPLALVFARPSSHASPHRHRARYGASQTTTCSQSVHRVFTGRRTRRSLSVVLAAATASDSIARGSEEARGGEGCEGGEGRRVAHRARFSVRRCGDGVA